MTVFYAPDSDPALEQAMARARESFGFFWRELTWERRRIIPGVDLAAVKAAFSPVDARPQDGPPVEHMWLTDVDFDGQSVHGVLINSAEQFEGFTEGTAVSIPLDRVEDWMYVQTGAVCGGFTIQAIRAGMNAKERAAHDDAWGLPFVPPEQILLTPDQLSEGAKRRPFGRRSTPTAVGMDYDEALAAARAAEHPMSENSAAVIEQQIAANPEAVHAPGDHGWTLLHLEASGGNLGPLQALLRHGADLTARTALGDTAADLAERLGWSRVTEALRAAA